MNLIYHPDKLSDWIKDKPIYPIYVEMDLNNDSRASSKVIINNLEIMKNIGVKIIILNDKSFDYDDINTIVNKINSLGLKLAVYTRDENVDNILEFIRYIDYVKVIVDDKLDGLERVYLCNLKTGKHATIVAQFSFNDKKSKFLNTVRGTKRYDIDKVIIIVKNGSKKFSKNLERKIFRETGASVIKEKSIYPNFKDCYFSDFYCYINDGYVYNCRNNEESRFGDLLVNNIKEIYSNKKKDSINIKYCRKSCKFINENNFLESLMYDEGTTINDIYTPSD